MDILLDATQAGVIGAMVPSNRGAAGKKHFVSSKHSATYQSFYTLLHRIFSRFGANAGPAPANLFSTDVFLTASVPANFAANFKWVNATPIPGSPHRAKVSRNMAGHFPVKIKKKSTGAIEAELNVWIVWSTITATAAASTVGDQGNHLLIRMGYNFRHKINPPSIITAPDRPDLSGVNTTSVPTSGALNYAGNNLTGGAGRKWDSSRIIRQKTINAAGVALPGDASFHGNFHNYPTIGDSDGRPGGAGVALFRDWAVVGNDDAGTGDEDNNPYDASGTRGSLDGSDTPTRAIMHTAGADGNTVEWRLHFQEFTRLEINGTWYLVSERFPWRVHYKAKRVSGKWTDDGSNKALDSSGF